MKPVIRPTFSLLLAWPLVFGGLLPAQTTVPEALKKARADLDVALGDLGKSRDELAQEMPVISAEFQEIEADLREKRRLVRIARQSREDRAQETRQLQSDLATRRQDATYLAGLLKDHALKTTTLRTPGEADFEIASEALNTSADIPAEALQARLAVLSASLDHLESLLGGSTSPGQASAPDGKILEGTFAAFGPASYFLSADKKTGGDVIPSRTGGIHHFNRDSPEKIAQLLAGNESAVPLDPTGGAASAMNQVDGGFLDLIRKGGFWIWPIILLALLSLVFGIIKAAQFFQFREPSDAWVNAILAAIRVGDPKKASALALDQKHPVGPVMHKLIEVSSTSTDLVEETLYEQLMAVQSEVSSMLPVIAITAATAPLLGLLGTVSGMIATFNLITLFGSGDPKPLAGGISEALVTTLFGLVVAIPALILHAFLSRRSQGIVQSTERLGLSFVNGLRIK